MRFLPATWTTLRKALAGIAAGSLMAGAAWAQAPEHDLKAAFIYNFVQFTSWPETALKGSTINLCVSQGTRLYMALQAIAGKPAHNRAILLRPLAEAQAGDCHVLVASADDRERTSLLRRLAERQPVLTITDDPELIRDGMMIGMALDNGRIAFIIDNTRAAQHGLAISSRLLRLARSVQ